MQWIARHSLLKHLTSLHAASCPVVVVRRQGFVLEPFEAESLARAEQYARDAAKEVGRRVSVCQCALDAARAA